MSHVIVPGAAFLFIFLNYHGVSGKLNGETFPVDSNVSGLNPSSANTSFESRGVTSSGRFWTLLDFLAFVALPCFTLL